MLVQHRVPTGRAGLPGSLLYTRRIPSDDGKLRTAASEFDRRCPADTACRTR